MEAPPAAEPTPPAPQAPKTEERAPSPKEDPKVAARFGVLARKEAQVLREKQELKAAREELAATRKALEARQADIEALDADPVGFLEKKGITYEHLTKQVLTGERTPAQAEAKAIKAELEKLKADHAKLREEREQEQRTRAAREAELAVEQYKREAMATIKAAGEKFELLNAQEEYELVHALQEEHFLSTQKERGEGELLSAEEAATLVEQHLESKLAKAKATKKYGAPTASAAPKPESEAASQPGRSVSTPTISNNLGATSATQAGPTDPMERALAFLEKHAATRK